MDLLPTEERDLFRRSVAEFVDREVAPAARDLDERAEFPAALFRHVADLGWLGLRYPEATGGGGADFGTFCILCEELARGFMSLAAVVAMQGLMGTEMLHRFGTPEQRERLLRPALRGEKIATIAMTEPDAGSDLGAIRTRAVRDGDGWVLSGTKTWITSASRADFFTVAAKTDPGAGFEGVDLFLVERGAPGLKVTHPIRKLCVRASETAEVSLADVRVPAESLLGGQTGRGAKLLRAMLCEIRVMTGALSLGLARSALGAAVRYAGERRAFGQPIAKHQAIRHKIAEMATRLEAARAIVERAAQAIDAGKPDATLAAMAKLHASEMANFVADEATRIFGAYGIAAEHDVERCFRDARFLLYGGGTSEVLRNVIAQDILR